MSLNEVKYTEDNYQFYLKFIQWCTVNAKQHTDQKYIADLPLKPEYSRQDIIQQIQSSERARFSDIEKTYFDSPDRLLDNVEIISYCKAQNTADWKLDNIKKDELVLFSRGLRNLWAQLSYQVNNIYRELPNNSTLVAVPHPFIIPGGRFKEFYYWDSYWTVRGLILCGYIKIAKDLIMNMFYLIKNYGFVPNGNRTYFLNRSQPPLLSLMVRSIYDYEQDLSFLETSLQYLIKEHEYWRQEYKNVPIKTANDDQIFHLTRYVCRSDYYRIESLRDQQQMVHEIKRSTRDKNLPRKFLRECTAACESGWDFSARWIPYSKEKDNLLEIQTSRVLPVDLNVYLYMLEDNIQYFAQQLGNQKNYKEIIGTFQKYAQHRMQAINTFMWNPKLNCWNDLYLQNEPSDFETEVFKEPQVLFRNIDLSNSAFASNYFPLFAGIQAPVKSILLVESIQRSSLIQKYGVAVSTRKTGHQWDYPNVWPPIHCVICEGFLKLGNTEGKSLALDLAKKLMVTMSAGFKKSGALFEKYNALEEGIAGKGGEYEVVQEGFGWSIGTALILMNVFGDSISDKK